MRRLAGEVGTTPMALYHHVSEAAEFPGRGPHLDPEQYPHLAALGPRSADLTARDTYRAGLEALVDGLLFPTAPG